MSYFKEELNWYWGRKMYVYPFKSSVEGFNWLDWKSIKDAEYEERMHTYYTEDAMGLNLVTGKKGICGIAIRRDTNDRYSQGVVQKALELLSLPNDYLWILKTPHEYIILLDVIEGFSNKDQKKFENIRIIWEQKLQLPIKDSHYSVQFTKEFYPQEHPIQRSKEVVYSCITKLGKKDILLPNTKSWWKRLFNL